jgi:hypothetical protein
MCPTRALGSGGTSTKQRKPRFGITQGRGQTFESDRHDQLDQRERFVVYI